MPKTKTPQAKGEIVVETKPAPVAGGAETPLKEAVLDAWVEAVLFSSDRAVSAEKIAGGLGDAAASAGCGSPAGADVKRAIARLNEQFESTGRSFRIEAVAGGFRVMTTECVAGALASFHGSRARTSLSRPAIETLAIIAYKQPITRARLEAIRGVACGEVLRTLVDRKMVAITGRAEELGRPMLYGTTRHFLEVFGLASIKDLPSVQGLRSQVDALGGSDEEDDESRAISGIGERTGDESVSEIEEDPTFGERDRG